MQVTHYFDASLTSPVITTIPAMQGDGVRLLVAQLKEGTKPWPVPEGISAGLSYELPDRAPGYYDRLNDGTPACVIDGDQVSVLLDPMLTERPGPVKASIILRDPDGIQVATFPFHIWVKRVPGMVHGENLEAPAHLFDGKIYYGGPGGTLLPLGLGAGVRAEQQVDGSLQLVAAETSMAGHNESATAHPDIRQAMAHLLPREELPGAVAAQIQAFEQGHDLELITSFKLTEAVSSLDITADADGNPFELETAVIELHTGTDGSCGEGSSGSVQINFGEAKYPYHLRLMDASGFQYRATASGTAYRDTGFTAYATTRNKLGLCGGYTGGFSGFDTVMLTMQNYKYLDSPISRINVLGNLPVNAAISVYGVRVGKKTSIEELPDIVGEAVEDHLETEGLPGYWLEHLALKIPAINTAMELAGKNKSAFFFYTDGHRIGSAGRTPDLLRYLYRKTGIQKTNSGGDFFEPFAEGADNLARVREHMADLRGLPNHHSVIGDHDEDNEALTRDAQLYGFYLAWEECNEIFWGGHHYYYIDNRAERTRYLYLDTGKFAVSNDEMMFVIYALTNAPDGWNVVAISHIWYDYQISAIPDYAQHLLDVFDAYNLRAGGIIDHNGVPFEYDFTKSHGRMAFCIGGHAHWDAVLHSANGIPVILTDSDSYYSRSGIAATEGTTSESCFDAVVADYDAGMVKLIRIGRGADRRISLPRFEQ